MTYRIVLRRTHHETILTFSGQLDRAAWQDLRRILSELGGGVVLELERGSGVEPGCIDLLRGAGVVTRTKSPYLRALLDGTWPPDAPGSDEEE